MTSSEHRNSESKLNLQKPARTNCFKGTFSYSGAVRWNSATHVTEFGIRNPAKFDYWNPESTIVEFGIQVGLGIRNPKSSEFGIHFLIDKMLFKKGWKRP